jgi:hypothetical protein
VATYEDAKLVVELMRWSTDMKLDESLARLMASGVNDNGSFDDPDATKVLRFGETLGTLVKHNVLDWDLLADLIWIEGWWSHVKSHAMHAREMTGDARMYEHFEALATRSAQ